MTWIQTCPPSPENPALAEAFRKGTANYPREYHPSQTAGANLPETMKNDSIILAHSLIPEALHHVFAAYRAVLDPALRLSRREQEMIATTVSVINDCYY